MRGGRGLKQGKKVVGVMEIEKKVENLTENHENPVSGAYIRSLVKQLSSSSPAPTPPPPPPPPQAQQRKKQARRRLHTTRPYQERLLNMAEARREIVTALKFHRAAKKQQKQQQEQEQPQREEEKERLILPLPPRPRPLEQEPNLCPSWVNNFSNIAPTGLRSPCLLFPPPPPPPPPPLIQENLNFPLPNQTLGLNLNFQDFDHLDASPYLSSNNPSIYLSSSSSSSSNHCSVSSGLHHHPSLDEREISEIKSIGEKHQMEWNDNMNLATSALWLEFLKTMEEEKKGEEDDYGCYHPFDEAMEFPVWLNAGDESCLEHNLNVNFSDDFCFQNPALPCIEEIQGNEVEWLTGED